MSGDAIDADAVDDTRRFRAQLADELVDRIEANEVEVGRLKGQIRELEAEAKQARNALRALRG